MPIPFMVVAAAVAAGTAAVAAGVTYLVSKSTSNLPKSTSSLPQTTSNPPKSKNRTKKRDKSYIILLGYMGAGKTETANIILGKGFMEEKRSTPKAKKEEMYSVSLGSKCFLIDTGGSNFDDNINTLDEIIKANDTESVYFIYVFDAQRYLENKEEIEIKSEKMLPKSAVDMSIEAYKKMTERLNKSKIKIILKILGTHADKVSDKEAIENLANDMIRKFGVECEIFAFNKAKPNTPKAQEMKEAIEKFIEEDNA